MWEQCHSRDPSLWGLMEESELSFPWRKGCWFVCFPEKLKHVGLPGCSSSRSGQLGPVTVQRKAPPLVSGNERDRNKRAKSPDLKTPSWLNWPQHLLRPQLNQSAVGILKFVSMGVRFVRFMTAVWFSACCSALFPVPFDLSSLLAIFQSSGIHIRTRAWKFPSGNKAPELRLLS